MSRKRRIESHYGPRLRKARRSHEALDWASEATQAARFAVLADNVPLAGRSLLDVGCGLGDLLAFLTRRGVQADYTGVDLLEPMIAEARRRLPKGRFLCADIFAEDVFGPGTFDVVYCSGTLNLNLGNNMAFLRRAVETFFRLSRDVVAFNLLHRRARCDDERYFYYDPDAVRPLLAEHAVGVRLFDNYLPNDFTFLCRKPSAAKQ